MWGKQAAGMLNLLVSFGDYLSALQKPKEFFKTE